MDRERLEKLSEMQRACLRLVAQLRKTEQIAAELGIAPSTVNTHIERAITRLGVPNRREAARLVVDYDATCAKEVSDDAGGAPAESLPLPGYTIAPRPENEPTEELPLPPDAELTPAPVASTTALGRRRNDLTILRRLLLAVLALVLLCIGIAGLGAAIQQLSQWRAAHGAHR